jgi:hypothetical protein
MEFLVRTDQRREEIFRAMRRAGNARTRKPN